VKTLINSNYKQSNEKLATIIHTALARRYTGHYFSVNSYNPVHGFDNHAIIGTAYTPIFRYKNHNVVVGWVSRKNSINTGTASAALSSVKNSGDCHPKNLVQAVWKKVSKYAVMVMVVPHGNGLRSHYHTAAVKFYNYVCKTTKNWFTKKKTDHKNSLIILYGSN
jgi:hypothetical protein